MKKGYFFIGLIIIGAVIGFWHLRRALVAIFVFRSDEPILSWVAIMCGPFSTFPAIIVAFFNKKVGGIWLISGGFTSLIAMFIMEGLNMEYIIPFFYMVSVPMLLIGISFLLIARVGGKGRT